MTKHLLRHPRVRVRVFTKREHLLRAEETVAAGNRKGHHHAIADFQVVNLSADLDDLAHELMTHYVALLHCGNESVVHVQVGTADRGRGDFYDRVALVQDL